MLLSHIILSQLSNRNILPVFFAIFALSSCIFVFCGNVSHVFAAQPSSLAEQGLKDSFAPVAAFPDRTEQDSIWLSIPQGAHVSDKDIFALYAKGEEVLDKNNNPIGNLKKLIGFCQVTALKTKEQLGKCKLIYSDTDTPLHDLLSSVVFASRYTDLPAFCSVSADNICDKLKTNMPFLGWVEEKEATLEPISLNFESTQDRLSSFIVINQKPALLHTVAINAVFPQTQVTYETVPKHNLEPVANKGSALNSVPVFDFARQKNIGSIKAKVLQAELMSVDKDGSIETDLIYLMPDAISAVGFQKNTPPVYLSFPRPLQPVNLSIFPEKGLVAVNLLWKDVGLRSMLLKWDGSRFTVLQKDINQWLAFLDMDGDGSKETFAGQGFSRQNLFGKNLYQLDITDKGISYGKAIPIPGGFSAIFAQWQDINQNGVLDMTTTDLSGNLCIYEKGELIWKTSGVRFTPNHSTSRFFALYKKKGTTFEAYPLIIESCADNENPESAKGCLSYFLLFQNGKYELIKAEFPFHGDICNISLSGKQSDQERKVFFIVRSDMATNSVTNIYEVDLKIR